MSTNEDDRPTEFGRRPHYADPMRTRPPELERCLVRHRALQLILIVYHAEELKRDVINGVAMQKRWHGSLSAESGGGEKTAHDGKKQKRAFDYLVQEGVLTEEERQRMVELIGRRNGIAHHLDQVTADLAMDPNAREWLDHFPDRPTHDYEALDQLRAARKLLSDRMSAHGYVRELNMRGIFFATTERVLSADLKAIERRIDTLINERRHDIDQLNGELSLEGTELTGEYHPGAPENRYGTRQRITPRGVETIYLLFDMGKSPLAVAHLMELSLTAARRRKRQWMAAGGASRARRPLAEIPKASPRY
jgi:hypothetical protein